MCDGKTGEGDGIDSNGWLVINGGTVISQACATSGDAGIDSDLGIYINGGKVVASGNMLDRIAGGEQTYAVFSFANRQVGDSTYTLKNADNKVVGEYAPTNDFTYLLVAGDELVAGDYTFWQGDTQLAAVVTNMQGEKPAGDEPLQQPDENMNGERPEMPEGMENLPEMPEGMTRPEGGRIELADGEIPQFPEGEKQFPEGGMGGRPGGMGGFNMAGGESSATFTIVKGANQFANVAPTTITVAE